MVKKKNNSGLHLALGSIKVRKNGRYSNATGEGSKMPGTTVDAGSDSPTPMDVPTFPDFSSMDCATLLSTINAYKALLAAPSFTNNDPAWVQAYTNAIVKAEAVYQGKGCNVTPDGGPKNPPPLVVVPPAPVDLGPANPVIPGASGGMAPSGGAGGGGGSSSSGNKPAAKKSFPWLLVAAGALGVYLVFGGGKSN